MMQYIHSENNPYSEAVILDDMIYLSGLVSENPETGELMLGTIEEETDQILKNLSGILVKNGSDMDHVVRVEIFLRDFKDRTKMNETYVRHFSKDRLPSRVCVQVLDLHDQCKIEVLVTAKLK